MTTICLNAGHTLKGKGGGAVGYINEAEEARKVVKYVSHYLRNAGYNVIIANVDEAATQAAYLQNVVKTANNSGADLFVSIHFNAGGGEGCEVYSWHGREIAPAVGVCTELSRYGFKNRGVKDGSGYYVIRKTTMEAMLVEVCFVDTKTDCDLYKKLGEKIIGQTIAKGIAKK